MVLLVSIGRLYSPLLIEVRMNFDECSQFNDLFFTKINGILLFTVQLNCISFYVTFLRRTREKIQPLNKGTPVVDVDKFLFEPRLHLFIYGVVSTCLYQL